MKTLDDVAHVEIGKKKMANKSEMRSAQSTTTPQKN